MDASNFMGLGLETWQPISCENMSYMFGSDIAAMNSPEGAILFNGDITNWDVSSVTNMEGMFFKATVFDRDLSWNVSHVTNMAGMFEDAKLFKGLGLENWNTSNVNNMFGMFGGATSFNGDISNWITNDVSNMEIMFMAPHYLIKILVGMLAR